MAVVLIIDDNAQIRDLWADSLSEAGFDVRAAPSGVQGMEIARAEKVDVIVTDIFMPEKDGIETLLEIKSVRPQAKVLVVSGGSAMMDKSFLEVAERLGADATLQKPVDIDRFCELVTRLAEGAKGVPDRE